MRKSILFIYLFAYFLSFTFSKTKEEWKTRIIYEILTDRFNKGNNDTTPCSDLNNYCGGTWKGIENNLDYIQGMGFNAIWISPIQPNSPGGYHGYWTTDFYGINEHFGTEQDLKDLIKACHERDIWVMIDIVANHVGYVQPLDKVENYEDNDYSGIRPFNDVSHYHKFETTCEDAARDQPYNDTAYDICWICFLPDLNQDNPEVRHHLLEWIKWFTKTYEVDGLRLDALRHAKKSFWAEFTKAAGVFTLGEAWNEEVPFTAQFQPYVDSPLNFPLSRRLIDAFGKEHSMTIIEDYYKEAYEHFYDISVLGNFVDNHDRVRFLSDTNDVKSFKAALAFVLCSVGIPTVYYGSEQGFNGGLNPANREPLWTDMKTDTNIYSYLKTIIDFRKKTELYKYDQIQRFADDSVYAFSRGKYFFGFTNSPGMQSRIIENHPYEEGTWLCNAFNGKDCVQVQDGKFELLIVEKEVKILFPHEIYEEGLVVSQIWQDIKGLLMQAISSQVSTMDEL